MNEYTTKLEAEAAQLRDCLSEARNLLAFMIGFGSHMEIKNPGHAEGFKAELAKYQAFLDRGFYGDRK